MKVYYNHSGYPEIRNFLYLKEVPNPVRLKQEIDYYKILAHLTFKIKKKTNINFLNSHFNPFGLIKKLRHFFNGISYNHSPWISTFETALPRYTNPSFTKKGIIQLASPYCKKLIALSECTKNIQCNYLRTNYPDYYQAIAPKIEVLHPPQELIIRSINEKNLDDSKIIFTFVGHDFFRKGGREIVNVFNKLAHEFSNFEVNIVSKLNPDQYASNTTNIDVNLLKQQFKNLPSCIRFHDSIPNNQVISLLKRSHVALLPTYADTYGYFLLEAQACGCPAITTNIRALPEINDNECGWVIEVPKDELGNGILKTESDRKTFSLILEMKLFEIISEILSHPEIITRKASLALERIQQCHNPADHAQKLMSIYQEAQK